MREQLKKPIELMRRDELVDLAQEVTRERDHHKESVRCMSVVFNDLGKIIGVNEGDVDSLLEKAAAHKQITQALAALKNQDAYWAMPECVHKLIAQACEATHAA
jgi:hypothetical protein